jgi:hypothetical protein
MDVQRHYPRIVYPLPSLGVKEGTWWRMEVDEKGKGRLLELALSRKEANKSEQ